MYELIQAQTADGLVLNGLLRAGDTKKSAIIFIHGFTTDFYSLAFYHTIASALNKQSHAILLAQTRGTGIETEFLNTKGDGVFIGSYFERLSDAHLDISAHIEYLLKEGYESITLIGHSLGTIKSVRYLFEGEHRDNITSLILLAPFDKNAFMERKAPGKWKTFVDQAKQKIEAGFGKERVPVPEFEDYAMSYETFYSWYEPSDLNTMWDFYRKEYDFPILRQIGIPVKIIVGENDDFLKYEEFGVSPHQALEVIKQKIQHSETVLIPKSGHTFFGYEQEVTSEVIAFL